MWVQRIDIISFGKGIRYPSHCIHKKSSDTKINYIHSNSLNAKWKLAAEPQHYKFSSAKFYYEGIDEWGFLENYLNVD